MKKNLALFASALALSLLSACGESNAASTAVGTYTLDTAAFGKAMQAQMPAEAAGNEMAAKMMSEMLEKMAGSVELKADGTAELMITMPPMGEQKTSGTWKLDGDKISMTTKNEEGVEETKVATLKDNAITVEEEQGGKKMTMVFRRK